MIPICVGLTVRKGRMVVDFSGTAEQVPGNINCPFSVAAAAVYYVFRCLMPPQTPACAGTFRPIQLQAPEGSLLNARRPAAVAAGNVETSSRVVDAVLGALTQVLPAFIPAASHGSMNNLAMGSDQAGNRWDYYETIGGGMGAGGAGGGLSGRQTHMTNTLNTPIEVVENRFPLRVIRYALRRGSGGTGRRAGGDGLIREFEFLSPAEVTLLTERRSHRPWGIDGGSPGLSGRNLLDGESLPGKASLHVEEGQRLTIKTPGGGGWGSWQ
ncbi:MAG: hydantoinase B/oxoprolinase family protein [gamma proteobacterium endosymbiont of Lamellibrachia anaximandri]|nr:hydantoinase B/oxoprolinase family protein [gamma proteobacterium endosymbiont of Lamellibrachia anaximandri]